MQKAGDITKKQYIDTMIGRQVLVLLETKDVNNYAFGYSDEYIRVKIKNAGEKLGEIVKITLDEENIAAY